MDSFLTTDNGQVFFMEEDSNSSYDDKLSMWVEDYNMIRPSTNLSIFSKLTPGMYKVDVSREYGIYCKKSSFITDELFTFSSSVVLDLLNEINKFLDLKDLYNKNNIVHKRGILIEGFPGTGKTSIISLLSDEIIKRGGVIFKVSDLRNLSVYIEFLKESFREIQPDTPVITIIEDIDKYIEDDLILDFLDGKSHVSNHIVLATTNNSEDIPDNLLRPSRIDVRVEVGLPSPEIREEYLNFKKVDNEISKNIAERTDGFSLADLKELYILVFILGYSIDIGIEKIKNPKEKKDYTCNTLKTNKLGI